MLYNNLFDLKKCKEIKTQAFESYLSDDKKSIIVVERVGVQAFFKVFNNFEKVDEGCYEIIGSESLIIKIENGYKEVR